MEYHLVTSWQVWFAFLPDYFNPVATRGLLHSKSYNVAHAEQKLKS